MVGERRARYPEDTAAEPFEDATLEKGSHPGGADAGVDERRSMQEPVVRGSEMVKLGGEVRHAP